MTLHGQRRRLQGGAGGGGQLFPGQGRKVKSVKQVAWAEAMLASVHIEEVLLDCGCMMMPRWRNLPNLLLLHPTESGVRLPGLVKVKSPEGL